MFDKIAVQMAEVAAQCELKNAQNQHGQTFHSFHEAESVLHEEIVESKDYFSMMQCEYEKLFTALREQDWEAFLRIFCAAGRFLIPQSRRMPAVPQRLTNRWNLAIILTAWLNKWNAFHDMEFPGAL